jgi:hypothetical protein
MASPLTVYSDASDGHIRSRSLVYATARTGGTFSVVNATDNAAVGQSFDATNYDCWEMFLSFDTSGVGAGQTVSAVVLSLYKLYDQTFDEFIIQVRDYDWGAALTSADWVSGADLGNYTLLATYDTTAGWGAGYHAFTSEDAIKADINCTGTTYYMLSSNRHLAGTTPTQGEDVYAYMADYAGTDHDPKIIVTYAPTPGGAVPLNLLHTRIIAKGVMGPWPI